MLKRGAVVICLISVLVTSAFPSSTFNVKSTITYVEPEADDPIRPKDPPLPGVEVTVWDEDDGVLTGDPWWDVADDELIKARTDENGEIMVNVTADDDDAAEVYLEVLFQSQLSSGEDIVRVDDNIMAGSDVLVETIRVQPDTTSPFPVDISFKIDDVATTNLEDATPDFPLAHAAARVVGEIYECATWLKDRTGFVRSEVPVSIESHISIGGNYIAASDLIWLRKDFSKNRVVAHEYGHAIMGDIYGFLNYPGPTNFSELIEQIHLLSTGHRVITESFPGFAFSEGWAEFFANAVHNDATFNSGKNPDGTPADMESNQWWKGEDGIGENNSGEVVFSAGVA